MSLYLRISEHDFCIAKYELREEPIFHFAQLSAERGLWDSDRGHWLTGKGKSIGRRPEPASRMYLAHLGCGVAPGSHEDHGQGRGDA